MSYSFSVLAANKAAAKEAVAAKFDEMVVASQPIHARDRAAVLANANTVIDLLADDDTKDVRVSCNGYVSWTNPVGEAPAFNTAAVNCQASHSTRAVA
jgi:hypothetical protein